MNKIEKFLIKFFIITYILLVSFNGIITKIIIKFNSNLLSIKSILPDIDLILLCFLGIIIILKYKFKINKIYLKIICFFIIIFIISLNKLSNINQFLITFRDILLPFLLLITLIPIRITEKFNEELICSVSKNFTIIIWGGFLLGIFQYVNGWEWASKFYTGYSFYGFDELSNIVIKTINGQIRVPSISGNHVVFGIMNFFAAYIFIIQNKINKCRNFYIKQIICFINIYLSTSRTILLMIIFLFISQIFKNKKIYKYIALVLISSPIYLFLLINIRKGDSFVFSTGSLIDRVINVWSNLFKEINIKTLLIGNNVYKVGAGLTFVGENNINNIFRVMDNSYIFLLFSYGFIGLSLFFFLLYRVCNNIKDYYIKKSFKNLTISILIGGIFTNLFQGRIVFGIYFFIYFLIKNIKTKKGRYKE